MSRPRRRPAQNTPPKKRSRPQGAASGDFWGSVDALPEPLPGTRPATDSTAIVRSLGTPPLTGNATSAEYYFQAVYDRAVGLASALAASTGLLADGSGDDQPGTPAPEAPGTPAPEAPGTPAPEAPGTANLAGDGPVGDDGRDHTAEA